MMLKPVRVYNFTAVILVSVYLLSLGIVVRTEDASNGEPKEDSLMVFTAKLLLKIKSTSLLAGISHTNVTTYEVEETYDQRRQLGKLVLYINSNEKVELYTRAQDNLYLEAHLGAKDNLLKCKLTEGRPIDGYFKIFEPIAELANQRSTGQVGEGHFIGPSSLLYLFREELRERSSLDTSSPSSSEEIRRELDFRLRLKSNHRLIVDPTPVEFSSNSSAKIIFKRTKLTVDRSPLLGQLAAFVSLHLRDEHLFDADFISIDRLRLDTQTSFDPFKLPAALACKEPSASASEHLEALELDQEWSIRFAMQSNRLSSILHLSHRSQNNVHVAFDSSRGLFNLRILDRSDNVVDIQNQLIYHMPNEQAVSADTENDVLMATSELSNNKIRNQECSILSGGEILGPAFVSDTSDDESIEGQELNLLSAWSFLLGKTNGMMYMGKVQYKGFGERLVHEFEISYRYVSNLPAYFVVLANKLPNSQEFAREQLAEGNIMVAKLWVSAGSCDDLHLKLSGCLPDPELVGFRLDLIDPTNFDVKHSEEIQFFEFKWHQSSWDVDDTILADEAFEVFNLNRCPLNRLPLELEVVWNQTKPIVIGEEATDLDQFVSSKLIDYLNRQVIGDDLRLVDFKKQLFPGAKFAKYLIDLAELPRVASQFRRATNVHALIKRQQMSSNLVEGSSELRTLFECLTWGSQFGNARSVLFSAVAGCWLYESSDELLESTPIKGDDHLFRLYDRHLESVRVARRSNDAESALEVFESKYLALVNKDIIKWNRRANLFRVSLNGPDLLVLVGIEIGALKAAPTSPGMRNTASLTLLAKSGYRFKPGAESNEASLSRAPTECVSFASCMKRCKLEQTCASFAYCHDPQSQHEYCQLSDLQTRQLQVGAGAQEFLVHQAGCEIHSKNYLAYFERETGARSSHLLDGGLGNRWYQQVGDKLDELDCAAACYSAQSGATCLRFIYCQVEFECFHWLVGDNRGATNRSVPVTSVRTQKCSSFKRKAISLYRLTLTTKSKNSTWTDNGNNQLRQVVISSLNVEQCADRCALDDDCKSFDSCRVSSFTGEDARSKQKIWSFQCNLLGASLFNQDVGMHLRNKSLDSIPSRTSTVEERHCDHYESLAAGSELSSAKVRKIIEALTRDRGRADLISGSSHAATQYFCASLIGLALGICVSGILGLVRGKKSS